MPITKSVKKALRQSEKRYKKNKSFKDRIKSTLKKYLVSPNEGDLKKVYSVLDKAKKKGIYHKNKTARLKSQLSKKVEKKAGRKMSTTK